MTLSPEQIESIAMFRGYGRSNACIWFIGLEEGLGCSSDDDFWPNLHARAGFHPVMDLVHAHELLHEGGATVDIARKTSFTHVWTWMARIVRAHLGESDWSSLEKAKEYVRSCLGRSNGDTFLTELSPWPRRRRSDTSIGRVLGLEASAEKRLLERRRSLLAALHGEMRPALTICYGWTARAAFASVLGVTWDLLDDVKIGMSQDRRTLLLPFLGWGHMRLKTVEHLLEHELIGHALTPSPPCP